MKKLLSSVLIVVLIGLVWTLFFRNQDTATVPTPTPTSISTLTPVSTPTLLPTTSPRPTLNSIILYSDSGYSPSTLKVKKGETAIFKNTSSKMMWTASAVHPTHKGYPGTDIAFCGKQTLVVMFDACKGYGPGESWEFPFNEQGTWKYHNHLQPSHLGTIIVE